MAMLHANGGVVLTMGVRFAITVAMRLVTCLGLVAIVTVTTTANASLDTGEMAAIVPRVQGIPTNQTRAMGSAYHTLHAVLVITGPGLLRLN